MKKVKRISKNILFYIAFFVGLWCLPIFSQEAYAVSETELLQTAVSHLKDKVDSLETELDNHIQNDSTTDGRDGADGKDGVDGRDGKDGVGISKIEKTGTNGNIDTYTISLTNGTTYNFTVTNGVDGKDGKDGVDGQDGLDGEDGEDGRDGKNAVLDKAADKESGSIIGTTALALAGVSLLGNLVLTAFMIKKKKN